MQDATADNLADALENLERARLNLVGSPSEDRVKRAIDYQAARAEALPAFAAAQTEYEADLEPLPEPTLPVPSPELAPTEAAPGVPLVPAPDQAVNATNIENFGAMAFYRSFADPEAPLFEATTFAFAGGTAVTTEAGAVATEQPSRITRIGTALGVITQDVFGEAYEAAAPGEVPPPAEAADPAPPAEEPAPAEPPATEPTPPAEPAAEGATPPEEAKP